MIPHFKAQGSARKKIEVREGIKDKLEYQITKFQLPSRFCPFLNYFATMWAVKNDHQQINKMSNFSGFMCARLIAVGGVFFSIFLFNLSTDNNHVG